LENKSSITNTACGHHIVKTVGWTDWVNSCANSIGISLVSSIADANSIDLDFIRLAWVYELTALE